MLFLPNSGGRVIVIIDLKIMFLVAYCRVDRMLDFEKIDDGLLWAVGTAVYLHYLSGRVRGKSAFHGLLATVARGFATLRHRHEWSDKPILFCNIKKQ